MKKTILVPKIPNSDITSSARSALKGYWFICAMTLFALLLTEIITAIITNIFLSGPAEYIANGILTVLINTIGGFAFFKYCGEICDGAERPEFFGSALKLSLKRFAAAALAGWYAGLIVFLKLFLLIVPGIMAMYDYALVTCIIFDEPDIRVSDALKRSRRLMYGHRWQFFCLGMRFFGWFILGVLTLGIGLLWIMPYFFTSIWKFYRSVLPQADSAEAAELPEVKPYNGMSVAARIFWFIVLAILASANDFINDKRAEYIASRLEKRLNQQSATDEKENVPPHECTSWMLFPDVTGENTTILHKSRDSKSRNVGILSGTEGKRKWLGLGAVGSDSLCMGFNSSGLAGVMNGGEKCTDNSTNENGKGTPQILIQILKNCDTAAQAVAMHKEFLDKGDYMHGDHGSIFFFADTKEGYLIEHTAHFRTVQKCDTGYALRANIWHHPGMAKYALTNYKTYFIESTREYVVRKALNDALVKNKKVGIQDILDLSRVTETPAGEINSRSLCCSWTNSASTFVIDREYPAVLSTAYLLVGSPRHTVILPVPICIKELPEPLTNGKFSHKSYQRMEKLKYFHPVPDAWLAFEKESISSYKKSLDEARKLMKSNHRAEAEKLLNDAFQKIWKKAVTLPEM